MLFDEWPEYYDRWFTTPIGKLVKSYETDLILELLEPQPGEEFLDAGCGTGVFTLELLAKGARVTGLDISRPMLGLAAQKSAGRSFEAVQGDMLCLPFKDRYFDKTVSITALEFVKDAWKAVDELFRVTRFGGLVVIATLNSLSPWAVRRNAKTQKGQHHILENAFYRSPDELRALRPANCIVKTAIHFQNDDEPFRAMEIEQAARARGLNTGAFVAVRWLKPGTGE